MTRNQPERALRAFAEVVRRDQDELSSRYQLGGLLQRAGETDQAVDLLEEAAALDRLQQQLRFPPGYPYLR